jgi:glycosyltransferase involved in cell wall biosynthesis
MFLFCQVKSENFGHAVYEALTAGRPVITSNNTPWNNLKDHRAGINVSTGDLTEMQNAIEFFVAMDQLQLEEWSNAAREYALQAVDMNETRKQYAKMFGG